MAFNHILTGPSGRKRKRTTGESAFGRTWSEPEIGEQGFFESAFLYRGMEAVIQNPQSLRQRQRMNRRIVHPDSLGVQITADLRTRSPQARKFAFFCPDFRSKANGISMSFRELLSFTQRI
jgi:hypothetical protein